MKQNKITLSDFTYCTLLSLCADSVAFEHGKRLHLEISNHPSTKIQTALINFYGKCGNPEEALNIFLQLKKLDVVAWNSIINAHGINGNGNKVIELFKDMQRSNILPNLITFQNILNACSHTGMLKDALYFFELMQTQYKIQPQTAHYNCIVDCFSRAGKLEEAENFIKKIPQPTLITWMSLLSNFVFKL